MPDATDLDDSLLRWVARLSCGHDLGSRGRVRARAVPAIGAVVACRVCREDGKIEDVVDTRPERIE